MTATLLLAGYALLGVGLGACQVAGVLCDGWPTAGQVVARVAASPVGRALLLAAWLWLGWHLFVRAHR